MTKIVVLALCFHIGIATVSFTGAASFTGRGGQVEIEDTLPAGKLFTMEAFIKPLEVHNN